MNQSVKSIQKPNYKIAEQPLNKPFENLIDITSSDFKVALTHRSYVNENEAQISNERLEFLGDTILSFIISTCLYQRYPEKDEGWLSQKRAEICSGQNLAKIAKSNNLGEYIYLGKGAIKDGARCSDNVLEDTLEAIIGQIYLKMGLEKAQNFIIELCGDLV